MVVGYDAITENFLAKCQPVTYRIYVFSPDSRASSVL
jgi:hypothetical protein